MPSRNSVNKPKNKIHSTKHASSIGKRRAARAVVPTRSSTHRSNTKTAPGPNQSKALALFNETGPAEVGVMTTNTLSNKRAKKLARNQRYLAQRNDKLSIDVQAKQDEAMEVDTKRVRNQKPPTQLDQVKQALWAVVEDHELNGMSLKVSSDGTTIGIQAF